ncbi:MAG: hypothetical protein K5641_07235 [Lachnospiraceae bacterium]|nr:hypothetical protein [Lachnospiraceae bacterium]
MMYFWLFAIVVFAAIEMITLGLTFIWPAIGCIVGAVLALLEYPIWMQVTSAIATTLILFLLLRSLIVRVFNRDKRRRNAETYLGRTGIVVAEVDNNAGAGEITMDGRTFAVSAPPHTGVIPVGRVVKVMEVSDKRFVVKER